MPIYGTDHEQVPGLYFKSLTELDAWFATAHLKLSGIQELHPRPSSASCAGRGRLLVCHDYKGGYTETPSRFAYTFNFWSACDVFVYFSHHRVTVPPPGWVTAAHRQGVPILGTLIFEHDADSDCLRLLLGNVPGMSSSGPAATPPSNSLPLSAHYAILLAELARQRGFDGYLLNFECPLAGGTEQTRVLAAWITLLKNEMFERVSPNAHVIWYDSVVYTGQLAWQDRLNGFNLPFFLASTGFFTNYTWPPEYPHLTAQYFTQLNPTLLGQSSSRRHRASLSLRDIYIGVDVWGRGSHGGGGFGSYKAIAHIDPEFLGLSVALFGPAWTWESEEGKHGWSWDHWWDHERQLWVKSEYLDEDTAVGAVVAPAAVLQRTHDSDKPLCSHGPFIPLTKYFERHSPPKPELLPLHVSFCPGVGRAWFVSGVRVFPIGDSGDETWTDIDKQTSLGDLVWPRPKLTWWGTEECSLPLPRASAAIDMRDAWNGGSSLRISLSCDPSASSPSPEDEDPDVASFHCVWIPIQSVSLTPGRQYEAHLMYKQPNGTADVGLSLRPMNSSAEVDVAPIEISHADYPEGWSKLSIQLTSPTPHSQHEGEIIAAAGLVIGFAIEDPSEPWDASIILGQLNVFCSTPPLYEPRILWATFEPSTPRPTPTSSSWSDRLSGLLKWEISASFPAIPPIRVRQPEDPTPVWTPDPLEPWFPRFLYFNVYTYVYANQTDEHSRPGNAVFIGTTGLFDGHANRFWVSPSSLQGLPKHEDDVKKVRFYVQGVTDGGVVLPWHQCTYVDVKL